jgi:YHS domain-containing protein
MKNIPACRYSQGTRRRQLPITNSNLNPNSLFPSQLPLAHLPEARDPVCGMTVEIATAHFTSQYEGTTYYFCAAGCKRSFDKEPQKYIQVTSR